MIPSSAYYIEDGATPGGGGYVKLGAAIHDWAQIRDPYAGGGRSGIPPSFFTSQSEEGFVTHSLPKYDIWIFNDYSRPLQRLVRTGRQDRGNPLVLSNRIGKVYEYVYGSPTAVVWLDADGSLYKYTNEEVQLVTTFPRPAQLTHVANTRLGTIYYATISDSDRKIYQAFVDGHLLAQRSEPFSIVDRVGEYYRKMLRYWLSPVLSPDVIRYLVRVV